METFTSTVTHMPYKINHSFDCNNKCLIYLLTLRLVLSSMLALPQIVSDIVGTVKHRKNLSKPMNGKNMGIPIYFQWIGKKYSHTLGNLWKVVSHIRELCRFFNSVDFYSKPTVWDYISFPHNIWVSQWLLISSKTHNLGMKWLSTEYFHFVGICTFWNIGNCMGSHQF